jgi:Flp pilus assembly pilin Flp
MAMQRIRTFIRNLMREEEGAIISEYGLLLAFVGIVVVGLLLAYSNGFKNWWNNNTNNLFNSSGFTGP